MLRICIILFLTLSPASALAGIRATYGANMRSPMVVEIADNGNISASLDQNRRLIVIDDRAFIVEDRLTGPLVTRLEDLAALHASAGSVDASPPTQSMPAAAQRGNAEVSGRSGQAFYMPGATGRAAENPIAVISSDPAFRPLGAAMRRVFAADMLLAQIEGSFPLGVEAFEDSLLRLLDQGAPLSFAGRNLRSLEQIPIEATALALPAEPETADAMRRRRAAEARDDEDPHADDRMISRAIFADGRLWLLTDQGRLSSLAEGEASRRIEDPGDNVLDVCVEDNAPVVMTGRRTAGAGWTIRRFDTGRWRIVRTIARSADGLVALFCASGLDMVLTSRRLIDLSGGTPVVNFGEELQLPLPAAAVHVTTDAVWFGLNVGEWGGGLRRIDRRTGAVSTVERNATGGLCDGPLNTACDPVTGVAAIPWRPGCIAAAIGLIHMAAHGRIVAVCPAGIEQMYVAADAFDPGDRREAAEAAKGGYGSVAFFGLTATADALIAVGHNGLYRIEANGTGTRLPWPRFVEVDGVLVSFALPDVVLVMTGINGRRSLSGITPLIAMR